MKRAVLGVLVALGAGIALTLPAPEPSDSRDTVLPPTRGDVPAIWYCPGAAFEADLGLTAAALAPSRARFSLAESGELEDAGSYTIDEPGTIAVDLGELRRYYSGASIIELTRGATAVGSMYLGPTTLAAETCFGELAKEWYLTGGSVAGDDQLVLRLFNPTLQTARVDVQVMTELGLDPAPQLDGIGIRGLGFTDVRLHELEGQRQHVSLVVIPQEGAVVPWMTRTTPFGTALWGGGGVAREWMFPVANRPTLTAVLFLHNPGSEEVAASVELFGTSGPLPGPEPILVPGGGVSQVSLVSIAGTAAGLRVSASGPLAATVVAEGSGGLAANAGLVNATRWLIPGGGEAGVLRTLVIANPGPESATVTVATLAGEVFVAAPVPPGGLLETVVGTEAVEVASDAEVSVGWIASVGNETSFAGAVPLADDAALQ